MLRKNLRESYKQSQASRQDKQKAAFDNTITAIRDRYKTMNKQNTKWIPKPISDENSLFSSKVPYVKAQRKPGEAARISLNIFELESNFKPSSQLTGHSFYSSKIFSTEQEEKKWRSSSKKSDITPISRECSTRKCFKASKDHSAKRSSIDLSWDETNPTNLNQSKREKRKVSNKNVLSQQNNKIFPSKKRAYFQNNFSSIQF